MTRPAVLMSGAYPAWDLEEMAARYRLLKLWEAPGPEAFIAVHAAEVRAIAAGSNLGASAALMRALPRLEIVACFLGRHRCDRSRPCEGRRRPGDQHPRRADSGRRRPGSRPAARHGDVHVRDSLAAHFAGRPLVTPFV